MVVTRMLMFVEFDERTSKDSGQLMFFDCVVRGAVSLAPANA